MTRIRIEPDAANGDSVFTDLHDAVLVFGQRALNTAHPQYGDGWWLHYAEQDGNGIDEYFIGGTRDDVDWAHERAKAYLAR